MKRKDVIKRLKSNIFEAPEQSPPGYMDGWRMGNDDALRFAIDLLEGNHD